MNHAVMCNVPNAGGCFTPWCSCWCHKPKSEPVIVRPDEPLSTSRPVLVQQRVPELVRRCTLCGERVVGIGHMVLVRHLDREHPGWRDDERDDAGS